MSKIKENIQHTEVCESLKNDVVSLRLDLTKVLEDRERNEDIQDDDELEQKLHTFRVSCCGKVGLNCIYILFCFSASNESTV